jgi:hypothetical protein
VLELPFAHDCGDTRVNTVARTNRGASACSKVERQAGFLEAEGLVAGHRLASEIMVAGAEIRGLPARGNQSMTRVGMQS